MIYLVDTNVLLRFLHTTDPYYPIVQSAVDKLRANNDELKATSQNFAEFWNVSTRPLNKNGFDLGISEANQLLQTAEEDFPLLPDSPSTYDEWRRLVVTYGVSGIQVHDARLVATMIVHGVTRIMTFDIDDFTRYKPEGIVAVNPTDVSAL